MNKSRFLKLAFAICTTILMSTVYPSAQVTQSEDGTCNPLHQARHIYTGGSATGYVDTNGDLWIESGANSMISEGKLLGFDVGFGGTFFAQMPYRILGPYHGTANAVKFDKFLMIGWGPTTIVATAENGDTWAYISQDQKPGNILCFYKNATTGEALICPGANSTDSDTNPSGNVGTLDYGWYRVTTNAGKNIVDVANAGTAEITTVIDEDGQLFVTANSAPSAPADIHLSGITGGYSRATDDHSYIPLTIPGGEKIVKVVAIPGSANSYLGIAALGENGNLFTWGNSSYGFSATPIANPLPGGVLVEDMEAWLAGLWIKGADKKLYFLGDNNNIKDLMGVSTREIHADPREVPEWTALGVDLESIPEGGLYNQYGWGMNGADGKMYFYFTNNGLSGQFPTSTDTPTWTAYEDLDPARVNFNYQSPAKGIVITQWNGITILNDEVLVNASKREWRINATTARSNRYIGTFFPNMDYLQFCYGFTEPDPATASSSSHSFRLNGNAISGPPSGGGPSNVGEGGTLAADPIDCSQTQIVGNLVEGTPSEVGLRIVLDVTTVGAIGITVDSSGLALKTDPYDVSTQTIGPNIFNIPLVYDGSPLGTFYFTVDGQTACSADLSTLGNTPMTTVNYVTDLGSGCTPVTPTMISK